LFASGLHCRHPKAGARANIQKWAANAEVDDLAGDYVADSRLVACEEVFHHS
jgi:hypothetical protein